LFVFLSKKTRPGGEISTLLLIQKRREPSNEIDLHVKRLTTLSKASRVLQKRQEVSY
jgi:hypothetical protein